MKRLKLLFSLIIVLWSLSIVSAQVTVPGTARTVTWGSGNATTTVATTETDTSDAMLWGFSYYHSVQYRCDDGPCKLEVWGAMANVDTMYKLLYTVEDSSESTGWSTPVSVPIAGVYYVKYQVTGLTGNSGTTFAIKEYIINLPSRRKP